jgi:hypothetical protein
MEAGLIPKRIHRLDPLLDGSYWASIKPDAIVVCLPKPLAGEGTRRQLQGVAAGLRDCSKPVYYIGPAVDEGPEFLASPAVEIRQTTAIPETFEAVYDGFVRFLSTLLPESTRSLLILSMGYTAFCPEAFKRARQVAGYSGRAICCVVDSAFPDTDNPNAATSGNGWPECRFYPQAYRSSKLLEVVFLLTSAYDYEPRILEQRIPEGITGVAVIAPPYANDYVARITEISRLAKRDRFRPESLVPAMTGFQDTDLIVPLVSSDIWSPDSVGSWMSAEQFETCTVGTVKLVCALEKVSRRMARRIWMPIHSSGARFLLGNVPDGVAVVLDSAGDFDHKTRVVAAGYDYIPQDDHTSLLSMADVVLCRTAGQSNASVVLALSKTPSIVLDMPARGYMQSELTSLFVTHDVDVDGDGRVMAKHKESPLGWRLAWSDSDERIATTIAAALEDPSTARSRAANASRAFESLYGCESRNLLSIIGAMTSDREQ